MDTQKQVIAALDRLGALLVKRDARILAEFAPVEDVILIGSEASEVAEGHEQLTAFFQRLLDQPVTILWEWRHIKVSSEGTIAWIYAEGDVLVRSEDGEKRAPYRMTGVLERQNDKWLWRQFHGAEPAKDR